MATQVVTRKRRTAEERREEITQAAITLFARQGFERTTTKEIAAEAGISEGTIYKYFASKQEILFSFLQPRAFTTIHEFFTVRRNEDPGTMFRALLTDRFALWDANRDLLKAIWSEAMFNPTVAEGLHRMITPAISVIQQYIQAQVDAGVFRQVNTTIAARTLIGMALAYFMKWSLLLPADEEREPREELIEELASIFLRGIAR